MRLGDPAPSFTAADETGRAWDLPVPGEWTWLWFGPLFVRHGCRECETSLAHELYPDLRAAGVMPFGLTYDPPEVGRRRNARHVWRVPLVQVSPAEASRFGAARPPRDPWAEHMPAQRSVLVDPDGRLARVWVRPDPRVHARQVLGAVAELSGS